MILHSLFLPCAAGVEEWLAAEVARICQLPSNALSRRRGGVALRATWPDLMRLNLHSRLAQRVLLQVAHAPYRDERELYQIAASVAWETWFTPRQSIKVEITAQHSPLKSLNFAALTVKDALCDRFRERAGGVRPDVDTRWPDVRVFAHLDAQSATLYLDTSGEALFKRGWRQDKGEAPLKETLAAAMLLASGWAPGCELPLYDPCCGSGTIAIEAAQIAAGIAPGLSRQFGFERLSPFQAPAWQAMLAEARQAIAPAPSEPRIFGSDVAHRMVDFAQRNAARAGVEAWISFRGGDALQRLAPCEAPGVLMLNPPYGTRIETAGVAGSRGRETAEAEGDGEFFAQLSAHWKRHFAGWTAWVLTPDASLPSLMRLKATRRVPLWNGPIECRLLRFEMVAGSARSPARTAPGS